MKTAVLPISLAPPPPPQMHVFSFERLAPLRFGRISVRFRLVPCEPADPIIIHISGFRTTDGGWLRLAFKSLASDAGLVSVELAASGSDVAMPVRCAGAAPGLL